MSTKTRPKTRRGLGPIKLEGPTGLKGRLGPVQRSALSEAQKVVMDRITGPPRNVRPGPGGVLPGPFNAYAYASPEIATAAERMGTAIRFKTSLDNKLLEIAILVVGHHWRSQFEFYAHVGLARRAGIADDVIEAIRQGLPPPFPDTAEGRAQAAVHDFARGYLRHTRVEEATYARAHAAVGGDGPLVDLAFTIGYYGNICTLLNVFNVGAPKIFLKEPEPKPPLPRGGGLRGRRRGRGGGGGGGGPRRSPTTAGAGAASGATSSSLLPHEPWGTHVPLIKAYDMAYVRFSAPDLTATRTFCQDFGLRIVHADADCVYSRGIGPDAAFCHVVHRGPPKFIGFAVKVRTEDDLHTLARGVPGCSPVHPVPGLEGRLCGGRAKRVHFIDPVCGFLIEAVHGQDAAEALPSSRARPQYNHGHRSGYERRGRLQDVGNRKAGGGAVGVPEVRRLGHVVISLGRRDIPAMLIFLHDTLGMAGSDTNLGGDGKISGSFLHFDRGREYSDHHSVFLIPGRRPGTAAQLSHVAFEVHSIDDVFRGHFKLKEAVGDEDKPYTVAHSWGIGRHVQGSQIYDYWHDHYGHVHEHWCDGDQVNEDHEHRAWKPGEMAGAGDQWGPTAEESTVISLFGPDRAPHFKALPEPHQQSVLSRDLAACEGSVEVVAHALRLRRERQGGASHAQARARL